MSKISVVIVTYNEEDNIAACLESVKWADEIIVVDDGSTDQTLGIVKKYTDKVYHHKSVGYVEPARNFAIEKASKEWILLVDADETIPVSLADKLQHIATQPQGKTHVFLPRKNIIFGKWMEHTGWWPDQLIRFFKKGSVQWSDEIHSVPAAKGESLQFEDVQYAIVHENYRTIRQFIQKNLLVYAAQEAKELVDKGYVFSYADVIKFPVNEFLSRYFARAGYKDGFHGLVLSLLMAIYHFFVFLYLWEQKGFRQLEQSEMKKELTSEVNKAGKDISFWLSKKALDEENSVMKKALLRIKRKLTL